MSVLQNYILPLFGNVPMVAKIIVIIQTLLFISSLVFWQDVTWLFCLIPINTVNRFFIWNLFTYAFIETEPFSFLFTILSVIITSKWIINKNVLLGSQSNTSPSANIWTTSMYLWFLVVMTCLCGVVTWISLISLYYILAVAMYNMPAALEEVQIVLLHSRYHGFHGLILGFTMILKQQIPDEFPINFIPLRAKNVPFITLVISVALSFLTNQVSDLPFIIFGFYISWVYLRFYQTTQDGTKGDHSDSFAFHTLFPSILHPLLEPFGTKVYNLARQFKIVSDIRTVQQPQPSFTNKVSLSSNFDSIFLDSPIKPLVQSSTSPQIDQHLTTPKTSEQTTKRRELALQELDKKLQSNMNTANKVDKSENV